MFWLSPYGPAMSHWFALGVLANHCCPFVSRLPSTCPSLMLLEYPHHWNPPRLAHLQIRVVSIYQRFPRCSSSSPGMLWWSFRHLLGALTQICEEFILKVKKQSTENLLLSWDSTIALLMSHKDEHVHSHASLHVVEKLSHCLCEMPLHIASGEDIVSKAERMSQDCLLTSAAQVEKGLPCSRAPSTADMSAAPPQWALDIMQSGRQDSVATSPCCPMGHPCVLQ